MKRIKRDKTEKILPGGKLFNPEREKWVLRRECSSMYYCICQAKAIRVLIYSNAVSRFLERFWTIQVLKLRVLCSLKDWKYRDLDLKAPPPFLQNILQFLLPCWFLAWMQETLEQSSLPASTESLHCLLCTHLRGRLHRRWIEGVTKDPLVTRGLTPNSQTSSSSHDTHEYPWVPVVDEEVVSWWQETKQFSLLALIR